MSANGTAKKMADSQSTHWSLGNLKVGTYKGTSSLKSLHKQFTWSILTNTLQGLVPKIQTGLNLWDETWSLWLDCETKMASSHDVTCPWDWLQELVAGTCAQGHDMEIERNVYPIFFITNTNLKTWQFTSGPKIAPLNPPLSLPSLLLPLCFADVIIIFSPLKWMI